jgi:hypothetical protein
LNERELQNELPKARINPKLELHAGCAKKKLEPLEDAVDHVMAVMMHDNF